MAILEMLPMSRAERQQRIELLRELDISHLANQYAYTLSGGEQAPAGNYPRPGDQSLSHPAGRAVPAAWIRWPFTMSGKSSGS